MRRIALLAATALLVVCFAGLAAPSLAAVGSVRGVRVAVSPATAGATATYTVTFTASHPLAAGSGTITIDAGRDAPGTAFPASGQDYSVSVAGAAAAQPPSAPVLTRGVSAVTIAAPSAIAAGAQVTLTVTGATNPLQPSALDAFAVGTSSDPAPARSATYAIATPPVSIGRLSATVYPNAADSGAFDPSQLKTPLFTMSVPLINFDPPAAAQGACADAAGAAVGAATRPFTDVYAAPGGRCVHQVAEFHGMQAGVGKLYAFEMVFTGVLYVARGGPLTFDMYSDDGWVLGFGRAGGGQPARVSGVMLNAPHPAITAVRRYPIVGAYNTSTAPVLQQVVVNFPGAGAYPVELDYTECCGGTLSIVAGTMDGNPIPPAVALVTLGDQSTIASSLVPPGVALGSFGHDVAALAVSAGMVLCIAFPAEVFNSTLEENYDEIREGWRRRFAWLERIRKGAQARKPAASLAPEGDDRSGVIAVILLGALLGSLLDPRFGFNWMSVESYLGMLGSMVFGLAVTGIVAHRYRRWRGRQHQYALHAIPAGLLVTAVCVLVSRLTSFEPGYLYGLICGVVFSEELLAHEEAHIVALTALANIVAAALLWLVWSVFNPLATNAGWDFPVVIFDNFLAAFVTMGLTGTVFSLLPLHFLPGGRLATWHRGAWSLTFLAAVFSLVAILVWPHRLVPTGGGSLITIIALFMAFGGGSVAFWWYFHRRHTGEREGAEQAEGDRERGGGDGGAGESVGPAASEPEGAGRERGSGSGGEVGEPSSTVVARGGDRADAVSVDGPQGVGDASGRGRGPSAPGPDWGDAAVGGALLAGAVAGVGVRTETDSVDATASLDAQDEGRRGAGASVAMDRGGGAVAACDRGVGSDASEAGDAAARPETDRDRTRDPAHTAGGSSGRGAPEGGATVAGGAAPEAGPAPRPVTAPQGGTASPSKTGGAEESGPARPGDGPSAP